VDGRRHEHVHDRRAAEHERHYVDGKPTEADAQMMQAAPAAPRAPATVADQSAGVEAGQLTLGAEARNSRAESSRSARPGRAGPDTSLNQIGREPRALPLDYQVPFPARSA
jgi:hypothetical protein